MQLYMYSNDSLFLENFYFTLYRFDMFNDIGNCMHPVHTYCE